MEDDLCTRNVVMKTAGKSAADQEGEEKLLALYP
jgi:hypothetical protein